LFICINRREITLRKNYDIHIKKYDDDDDDDDLWNSVILSVSGK
jgi:hypothetical protein